MAQFIPFSPNVEVNGQTILSFINAVPNNALTQRFMGNVLKKHSLNNLQADNWYSQTSWLNAFKEISTRYGESTLFSIGKVIPENAIFPPQVKNLEGALASIDVAYNMNHRGGAIGYYKLVSFDGSGNKAIMECKNPYPSNFDRGIITTIARKFSPTSANAVKVELDESKPSRLDGSDSCTYMISW